MDELRNKRGVNGLKKLLSLKIPFMKSTGRIHCTGFPDLIKLSFLLVYPFSFCLRNTWLSAYRADGSFC